MKADFTAAEIDYIEKNLSKKNLYGDTRNRIIASLYQKGAIVFFDMKSGEQVNVELKSPFDVIGGVIRFTPELMAYVKRFGGFNNY